MQIREAFVAVSTITYRQLRRDADLKQIHGFGLLRSVKWSRKSSSKLPVYLIDSIFFSQGSRADSDSSELS